MSYSLEDLPIHKTRDYTLARNIFGLLTVASGAAWFYLSHADPKSYLHLSPWPLVTVFMAACTWWGFRSQAVMDIDDQGFHYYGRLKSLTCRWDEIASVDRTVVKEAGRGGAYTYAAIQITLKSDGRHKPATMTFINDFGVAPDNLILFLRQCTARFGRPEAPAPAFPAEGAASFGHRHSV